MNWKFWKRVPKEKYYFTHPKAKAPKIIFARSEEEAREIMKEFVIHMMYGDWALTYDAHKVNAVMGEMTVIKQEGEGK